MVDDKRFPWQFNWLTAGQCLDPHYHKRLCETYLALDSSPGDLLNVDGQQRHLHKGLMWAIQPGCIHNGNCADATILLCVLRQHDYYPDKDMHTEDLPEPSSDGHLFTEHDVSSSKFDSAHWPYRIGHTSHSGGSGTFTDPDHTKAIVLPPSSPQSEITIGGHNYPIGPGTLIALEPNCGYQVAGPTEMYHFTLLRDWENRLDALAL